jgi:hypothetical protein
MFSKNIQRIYLPSPSDKTRLSIHDVCKGHVYRHNLYEVNHD